MILYYIRSCHMTSYVTPHYDTPPVPRSLWPGDPRGFPAGPADARPAWTII